MVSSRRQISRDEDRYGGFAEVSASNVGEREISDDILNMRSYVTPSEKEASLRDTAPAVESPERKDKREAVSAPRKAAVRPVPVESERVSAPSRTRRLSDVMPEIVRPLSKEKTIAAQPAPVIRERKLTASAKRALVIYMSIVLAVVAGIIATGVAVSSVSAQVLGYETSIAMQEEAIIQQREALAQLANESVIADAAGKLGMVEIDGTSIYDRLEIGTAEDDASGVFDSIRDWFNAIFGG